VEVTEENREDYTTLFQYTIPISIIETESAETIALWLCQQAERAKETTDSLPTAALPDNTTGDDFDLDSLTESQRASYEMYKLK
jgi:hypothetical protein